MPVNTPTKTRKTRRRKKSSLGAIFELAFLTFWGRVLMTLIIAAILAAVNLLVSGNRFNLFFQITGIELVLVAAIFWIRFMLRKT